MPGFADNLRNLQEIIADMETAQSQAENDQKLGEIFTENFTDAEIDRFNWEIASAMLPGFDPPAVEMAT